MRTRISIPYHELSKGLIKQINNSSNRRQMNPFAFILKKMRNHIFQILALYCPLNSLRVKLHKMRGVSIGQNVFIGFNCVLDHSYPEYIYIGDNCGLNGDVYILTHTNPNRSYENYIDAYVAPVIIGRNSLIGIRCTILPGVEIGENVIVSAGTVVSKNIKTDHIVAPTKNRTFKYRS